jgi:hypothetical protein
MGIVALKHQTKPSQETKLAPPKKHQRSKTTMIRAKINADAEDAIGHALDVSPKRLNSRNRGVCNDEGEIVLSPPSFPHDVLDMCRHK